MATPEQTILIVEDEPKIAALLNDYIQSSGYLTHWIGTGETVDQSISHKRDI